MIVNSRINDSQLSFAGGGGGELLRVIKKKKTHNLNTTLVCRRRRLVSQPPRAALINPGTHNLPPPAQASAAANEAAIKAASLSHASVRAAAGYEPLLVISRHICAFGHKLTDLYQETRMLTCG